MSLRAIWILMVVFLLTGTFAVYDFLVLEDKREQKKDQEQHVVWLKGKKLSSIKIKNNTDQIRFECLSKDGCAFDGSADWALKEPVEDLADSSSVASLASSVLNLTFQDKLDFESPLEETEFALDSSKLEVELNLLGETSPVRLKVGRNAPVGSNVYLQLNGDKNQLFTVATFFSEMLQKDLFHWRNKRLFPKAQAESVEKIAWRAEEKSFAAKRENGKWLLTTPIKVEADQVMLESLASTLAFASAKELAKAGTTTVGKKKFLDISFEVQGKEQKLTLWEGLQTLATTQDSAKVYVLDKVPFARFRKNLMDFRNRKVWKDSQTLDELQEVTFEFPKDRVRLKLSKGEGRWRSDKESQDPLSQGRINRFLESLLSLEAVDIKTGGDWQRFNSSIADLVVTLPGGLNKKFVILNRKIATTEYEKGQVAHLNDVFLKLLPIREVDLRESGNKQVVEELKGKPNGETVPHGDHSKHIH